MVVLFFYPKASTPGCTKEACRFRDEFATFQVRLQCCTEPLPYNKLRSHSLTKLPIFFASTVYHSSSASGTTLFLNLYCCLASALVQDMGAQVMGISSDAPEANAAFAKAQRLPFPLLSDTGSEVRKALGVKGDLFGLVPGRQVGFLKCTTLGNF